MAACPEGPVLDVGGGTAHIKQVRSDVLSVDILPFPGIDAVCDAHCLAFPDGQFAGVIMIDVLHHLERPIAFLKEAARVLRPRRRARDDRAGDVADRLSLLPISASGTRGHGGDPFVPIRPNRRVIRSTPIRRSRHFSLVLPTVRA